MLLKFMPFMYNNRKCKIKSPKCPGIKKQFSMPRSPLENILIDSF